MGRRLIFLLIYAVLYQSHLLPGFRPGGAEELQTNIALLSDGLAGYSDRRRAEILGERSVEADCPAPQTARGQTGSITFKTARTCP